MRSLTVPIDYEHSVTTAARLFRFQIRFAVQIRRLDKDSATTLLDRKKSSCRSTSTTQSLTRLGWRGFFFCMHSSAQRVEQPRGNQESRTQQARTVSEAPQRSSAAKQCSESDSVCQPDRSDSLPKLR